MKNSSELREEARNNLSSKWGEAILVSLIYWGTSFGLNFAGQIIPFGSLLLLIVSIPFSYGLSISFLKLKRNDNFSYGDIFTESFNKFTKIWSVIGNMCLKLLLPIILLIVSIIIFIIASIIPIFTANSSENVQMALIVVTLILMIIGMIVYFTALILLIIKGYYYSLSVYLLYDNPNMSGKEIVELSESLMKDQRGNLFMLQLSFIGWAILAMLTCALGFLFLIPYVQFATISFYEDKISTTNQ